MKRVSASRRSIYDNRDNRSPITQPPIPPGKVN